MSRPVLSRSAKLGVRKPLLRRSSIGNVKYGAYRIGTPLNSSFIARAVPKPRSKSSSISDPSSRQERSPSGHVVKKNDDSDRRRSLPSMKMSSPEPRADRDGISNPASSKLTV